MNSSAAWPKAFDHLKAGRDEVKDAVFVWAAGERVALVVTGSVRKLLSQSNISNTIPE